jgi:hypothetical protein
MYKSITAITSTEIPTDTSVASVTKITLDVWAKQGWQRPAVSASAITRLIERRYSDLRERMRALDDLTTAVAPLLAIPGYLTDAEYREHLQDEMRRLLPFLDGTSRKTLASILIAEHAKQNNADVELFVDADQAA